MKIEATRSDSHAARLIEFSRSLTMESIPADVIEKAKGCLLDALGCGLFGSTQHWSKIVAEEVFSEQSRGTCTVLGYHKKTTAPAAALCNGTAMHGFELDDIVPAALIHPGTVIVPAVLASAEASDASGAQLLRGIVVGYEAMTRMSHALGLAPSQRGFHKTGVVGPVAAALGAGAAMELSSTQLTWAVGLACSTASGIKSFAGGTGGGMVKRLHAGRAAEAGVRTSQLARRGFTGPSAALDGRLGLLEVFAGDAALPARLSEGLGEHWAMRDVWVKVYPACGWIQGLLELLIGLQRHSSIDAREVERVVVGTSNFAVMHNGNLRPSDTMEAQYSIPYCVAVALTGDPNNPASYAIEAVNDPVKRAIADRVELRVDPASEAVYPRRFGTRIDVHLRNGDVRSAATLDPHGSATNPCTEVEVADKFERLASLARVQFDASAVSAMVSELDKAGSTRLLAGLMKAA